MPHCSKPERSTEEPVEVGRWLQTLSTYRRTGEPAKHETRALERASISTTAPEWLVHLMFLAPNAAFSMLRLFWLARRLLITSMPRSRVGFTSLEGGAACKSIQESRVP